MLEFKNLEDGKLLNSLKEIMQELKNRDAKILEAGKEIIIIELDESKPTKEVLIKDWMSIREFLNRSKIEKHFKFGRSTLADSRLSENQLSEDKQDKLYGFFKYLSKMLKKY